MLQIFLPERRRFNEKTEEFETYDPMTLKLEHSLISISKWEAKWHKSYLSSTEFTREEQLDYIRCMSLDPNLDPKMIYRLTSSDIRKIEDYIHSPMTATTFAKQESHVRKQIITAEIVYYWMITYGIPFDCAKWHLNQLMTLIEVCARKNVLPKQHSKKGSRSKQWGELNKARRARLGTSG